MATPTPTPRTLQPPPELPNDAQNQRRAVELSAARSASGARHGFADKLFISSRLRQD